MLEGREVAITGRLASMTRRDAIATIQAGRGRYSEQVTEQTDWLVVGENGWPLRSDGRLTQHLVAARTLEQHGASIDIITETEFLTRTAQLEHRDQLRRLFTMQQLSRMLDVPLRDVRRWLRAGVIRPAKKIGGAAYFDFTQVANAKSLLRLLESGATLGKVRASVARLRHWLPDADSSLSLLEHVGDRRPLEVHLGDGKRAGADGQLLFDFTSPAPATPARIASLPAVDLSAAERQLEAGLVAESEGRLEEAERSYRTALQAGSRMAEIAFNLGNVLYRRDKVSEAAQRFREAVEWEPRFAEAWNNLGNALADLHRTTRAIEAYRRAIELDPGYADAHFNLAQALENSGFDEQAAAHWRAYLSQDPNSAWAAEARERLAGGEPPEAQA